MKNTAFFKYATALFISLAYSNSCLSVTFDEFAKSLARVESSNNPKSFNSKENAIGLYQIRPLYFKDAQVFDKDLAKYTHKDCFDPRVAKRVVWAYFMKYEKTSLINGNWENLAKLHNGGCGWKSKTGKVKSNLDTYWTKVQKYL